MRYKIDEEGNPDEEDEIYLNLNLSILQKIRGSRISCSSFLFHYVRRLILNDDEMQFVMNILTFT